MVKVLANNGSGAAVHDYKQLIREFLRNKLFVLSLLITTALGYGFTLTNYSYGLDDTAFSILFNSPSLLSTGRFTAYLINKIFGIYEFAPFWQDFLAIMTLLCAVIFWCALIKRIVGDAVSPAAYIAFAAVFISFPNINEIFIYMIAGFSIGLGFLLTGIALAVCYEVFFNGLNWKWLSVPCLLMCFAVSLYESFAVVFLCAICMIMILRILFCDSEKRTLKYYAVSILQFCGVLVAGIFVKYVISFMILHIGHMEPSTYDAVQIQWGKGSSLLVDLRKLVGGNYTQYILHFSQYLYTFLFDAACLLLTILGVIFTALKKDFKLLFLFLGLFILSFSLSVIQGVVTPMRANQSHMVLVAFTVWILCAYAKKWRRPLVLFVSACLVLYQTKDLSQWFYNDYRRYQQDKQIVLSIGSEIGKLDITKPVVFEGNPLKRYPNLKYNETNGSSLIYWGMTAYGSDIEILEFFRINGFPLVQSTPTQKAESAEIAQAMPAWPQPGSVREYKDIIVVNFGNSGK